MLEKFANLRLNMRKTQLIPLGLRFSLQSLETFMDKIRAKVPLLAGAKARFHAEYLGFIVGPRCSSIAWKKPWDLHLSRFDQLVAAQRSASTLVPIYNMSVATTLSYTGQL